MTSYNIEVLKCYKCNTEFTFWNVNSCNTLGAMFFTDGSIIGSMYDPGVLLIGCPSCQNIFWFDERNVIREMNEQKFFKNKSGIKIPSSKRLAYMEVVVTEMWRMDSEEKAIRIRAWHEFNSIPPTIEKSQKSLNDLKNCPSEVALSPKKIINYDAVEDFGDFIKRLDEDEEFRHLGLFTKAVNLLTQEFSNALLMTWKEKILELSMKKQTDRQLYFKGE